MTAKLADSKSMKSVSHTCQQEDPMNIWVVSTSSNLVEFPKRESLFRRITRYSVVDQSHARFHWLCCRLADQEFSDF